MQNSNLSAHATKFTTMVAAHAELVEALREENLHIRIEIERLRCQLVEKQTVSANILLMNTIK